MCKQTNYCAAHNILFETTASTLLMFIVAVLSRKLTSRKLSLLYEHHVFGGERINNYNYILYRGFNLYHFLQINANVIQLNFLLKYIFSFNTSLAFLYMI